MKFFWSTKVSPPAEEHQTISFVATRVWDAIECQPPCCPRAYLFESDDKFVYLESWDVLPAAAALSRNISVTVSPKQGTVLSFSSTGERIEVEQQSIRDTFFDFGSAEFAVLQWKDLPEKLRVRIAR